jgi:uncharacterized protein YegL
VAVLPLVILADTSGSMAQEGKIDALNEGLRDLVRGCAARPGPNEVHVAVIAFGTGGARVVVPFTPADHVSWIELDAGGGTTLGAALLAANRLLDGLAATPGLLQPIIVLASDGGATDDWAEPLAVLTASATARVAERLALAIGPDADYDMLALFVSASQDRLERIVASGLEQDLIDLFRDVPLALQDVPTMRADEVPPVDPAALA